MNKVTSFTENRNGKYLDDKEMVGNLSVIHLNNGKMELIARSIFWMSRSKSASKVYCTVWVGNNQTEYSVGHGSASGYGYHRPSAALSEAFESAGVKFEKDFSGHGSSAMEEAMLSVSRYLTNDENENNFFVVCEGF